MTSEAHVRIDEGIKRGPRKPQKARRRSPEADLGTWVIPADLNATEVLERYLTDSTTSQIAAQYGLSRKALVKWLRDTKPAEWKQVQVVRAFCKKESADDEIEGAVDALSLARAREMLRSGQWDLERLDSANYGAKQEVTVKTEVKIETVLDGDACALLAKLIVSQAAPVVAPSVSCTAIEAEYTVHPDATHAK